MQCTRKRRVEYSCSACSKPASLTQLYTIEWQSSEYGSVCYYGYGRLTASYKFLAKEGSESAAVQRFLRMVGTIDFSRCQQSKSTSSNGSYWAVQERSSEARDIGHVCKECRLTFLRVGEDMVMRRGGRIELRYHKHCFSGEADPRTQRNSSFNQSGHDLAPIAPTGKFRKMRTSSQF